MDEQAKQYAGLSSEYNTPPLYDLEKGRENLLKQLSPEQSLLKEIHQMKGEIWDEQTKQFEKVEGIKPLMNDAGISIFWHSASSVLNPVVAFSNYRADIKTIHNLVLMQVKKASVIFHLHWRDFDIAKKTEISLIVDKLMILGLSAYYQALGAGHRKAGTSNISESSSTLIRPPEDQQEKRRGFISRINPLSR